MVVFPNAKINLGLNIVSKREDGYHDLQSCFYPIGWCDVLEIIESERFGMEVSGIDVDGPTDENLVSKAYRALRKDYDLPPIKVHLHKIIPIGAGLGGGSADAAFAIKALNELFGLALSPEQMEQYAGKLGSDCPFFIRNQPMYVTSTGNEFSPLDLGLKGKFILLIYPNLHISTKEAYAGITPAQPTWDTKETLEGDISKWKGRLVNDFEQPLFGKYPKLKALKDLLYAEGALYASMSGSGSTIYGIFEQAIQLDLPPDHTIWSGALKV